MGVMVAIIIGGAVITIRQERKRLERLNKIADNLAVSLNLTLEKSRKGFFRRREVTLSGRWRGRETTLRFYSIKEGNNVTHYTEAKIICHNPGMAAFKIREEGIFTEIADAIGAGDVKTGDTIFDKRFYIKCKNEEYIRIVLGEEARKTISVMFDLKPDSAFIQLNGTDLIYRERKHPEIQTDETRIMEALNMISLLADKIESVSWEDGKPVTFWEEAGNSLQ